MWVRRMSKLTEVFWESVSKSWCGIGYGAVANFREVATGGRDRDRYDDDERVNPGVWMVSLQSALHKLGIIFDKSLTLIFRPHHPAISNLLFELDRRQWTLTIINFVT